MKRIFKVTGIVLVVLMALLVVLPYAFQGKIEGIIKKQGNEMLNARFDFESLDISLIRNFPSASVSLHNFWLKGQGEFANDTLVKAGELTATVNVLSLLGDSGYEIGRILIHDTQVKAVVLKDGKVNWDVMKENTDGEESGSSDEASAFRVKLEELKVDGLTVEYDDREADLLARIENMNALCSGDFGSERTLMKLMADIPAMTYISGGVPLLNKVNVQTDMNVDADMENQKFVLKENQIKLNAIALSVDGWAALLDDGIDMDLKMKTNDVGFKEVLSLVPAIYAKDFEGLKAEGVVKMDAFAKGQLKGNTEVPQFGMSLKVDNAMFRYPSLPMGVDGICINIKAENPGGDPDKTTVNVNPLKLTMDGNPISLIAAISHPVSDMQFDLTANGKMNLGKIKDVYPLEDMQLNGIVDANVKVAGKMSYIEKEKYDKIESAGRVVLSKMQLDLDDMPRIDIKQSVLDFSPKYLKLSSTTVNIGDNDITLDSRFENYMAFALKGGTLRGNMNVSSNNFNLNDFMTADSTAVESEETLQPEDTIQSAGIIRVPGNIDFRMNTHMKSVKLDNMHFQNVIGILIVKDSKVDMQNLSMNTMGGTVKVNGAYSTPKGEAPGVTAGFDMSNISFSQAYSDLGMVRQMAPIFQGLKGNFSGNMKVDTRMNEDMSIDARTLNGNGSISTHDLSLSGVKFIDQVADIVKKPSLKDIKVKNLKIDFTIADGRVSTQPFDLKLGDYKMNLTGSTGLDQTIDYKGKITMPISVRGKQKTGTVGMNIGGTFTSPKVGIDMESMLKSVAQGALDELLGGGDEQASDSTDTSSKKNVLDKVKGFFKKKK